VLVNSADADRANSLIRDAEAAARAMGLQLYIQNASTSHEIDAAFVAFAREQSDALFVGPMCSSITGACNLQTWQRVMGFQQVSPCVTTLKLAGS
jgi:ABC-type uncharacterized transport system substrate-binding protein